jgi:antirestriction protein ArdC
MNEGVVPWRRPWRVEAPKNLMTKREYRGVNAILLGAAPYESPYWTTFRQAKELGGHVRRGERSLPLIFWKWIEREEDEENSAYALLRSYRVFNTEQCEGLEARIPESSAPALPPIEQAERIVAETPHPPAFTHGGQSAFYRPSTDELGMPSRELFETPEEYYSTLFHELTHSTGHPSRLHRFEASGNAVFGSEDYSLEELVAEMGAAFLSNRCRIERRTLDNSAAYISSWLRALENDQRMVVHAGARAQRAADYILRRPEEIPPPGRAY